MTAFALPPTVTAKSLLSGAPVTTSFIVRRTSLEPPFAVAVLIAGSTPSMTIFLFDASDAAASRAGIVTVVPVVAELPAKSLIVPPFNAKAVVDA